MPGPGSAFREQLWVESTGDILIAKMRGPASTALLEGCRQQVVDLLARADTAFVLFDALELHGHLADTDLPTPVRPGPRTPVPRGAIVLSDARLRRALLHTFTGLCTECRLFAEDLVAAYAWVSAAGRNDHQRVGGRSKD